MGILEKDFNTNFTQVPNNILNDLNVSCKAKGLYTFMVSKPDKWDFKLSGLQSQLKEGRNAILNIIDELSSCGYLTKVQSRVNGRFQTNKYILHLEPKTSKNPSKFRNSTRENQLGFSNSENATTSNTIGNNTKRSNTKTTSKKKISFDHFRDIFINEFSEGFTISDLSWRSDTVFTIQDGKIFNTVSNRLLTKEDSYEIWNYLYTKFQNDEIAQLKDIEL
ncbi:hypothetical protein [Sulfurimonas microaerophilic]|uniref:hypothetical protein n=1 Tax=Sulfurimonas microaerophilic TaxID=3058392 RepID=UPI0027155558|nr:hypothetical protein [Sulfurimonas sp. hsl 1-7]